MRPYIRDDRKINALTSRALCSFSCNAIRREYEHGFTSAPTQYRLYGRRFLQVWWPYQQCQSTEGGWLVIQTGLSLTRLTSPCYNTTRIRAWNTRICCLKVTITTDMTRYRDNGRKIIISTLNLYWRPFEETQSKFRNACSVFTREWKKYKGISTQCHHAYNTDCSLSVQPLLLTNRAIFSRTSCGFCTTVSYLRRSACRCYCTVLRRVRWKSHISRLFSLWLSSCFAEIFNTRSKDVINDASFIQFLIKLQNGNKNSWINIKALRIHYVQLLPLGLGYMIIIIYLVKLS